MPNSLPQDPPSSLPEDQRRIEVIQSLKQVVEPTLKRDIVSLGMVRNLRLVDDYVYLRLYIGSHQHSLEAAVQDQLADLGWCKKVYIQRCTIPGVRTTLAVSSGKGGVGKSTVAVNLAIALQQIGAKVGLLDADVYGPNIPQMLGLEQTEVNVVDTAEAQQFLPLEAHGIQIMSVGLLAEPDHPLAWRGPVLHKIITQFIQQVQWDELDFLLIDLPPGTGDAQITIIQESPICGVILVTTPQQVAVSDVRRSVHMFRRAGVPVLGIVENMSYLISGAGEPIAIFGSGGGQQLATELETTLLGKIPLDPQVCLGCDQGRPVALTQPDSIVTQMFQQIAQGLVATFRVTDIYQDSEFP